MEDERSEPDEERNSVERLEKAIKLAEQDGGRYVAEFAEDLKADLTDKGKRAVELDFERHTSKFLSAIILDRMADVPRMVKFVSVCDELLYGKENHMELVELAIRNPRTIEAKRNTAKEFISATVSLASKMSKVIQESALKDSPNEDLSGQIRRILEGCSRDELVEGLRALKEAFGDKVEL